MQSRQFVVRDISAPDVSNFLRCHETSLPYAENAVPRGTEDRSAIIERLRCKCPVGNQIHEFCCSAVPQVVPGAVHRTDSESAPLQHGGRAGFVQPLALALIFVNGLSAVSPMTVRIRRSFTGLADYWRHHLI